MRKILIAALFPIITALCLSGCGTPGYIFASEYNGMPKAGQEKISSEMKKYCPLEQGFKVGMVRIYLSSRVSIIAPPGYSAPSPNWHLVYACYKMSTAYFYAPCPANSYRPGYGNVCIYTKPRPN